MDLGVVVWPPVQASNVPSNLSISRNFFMGREIQQRIGPLQFLNQNEMDEISHNAYEVYEVADRFVVLQHGKNYAELASDETNPKDLIEVITGRK